MFCYLISVVRKGKTLQDIKKNDSTLWRSLYYAKEGILMGGKVPKLQNKCH
jgi:hypothetical protein